MRPVSGTVWDLVSASLVSPKSKKELKRLQAQHRKPELAGWLPPPIRSLSVRGSGEGVGVPVREAVTSFSMYWSPLARRVDRRDQMR